MPERDKQGLPNEEQLLNQVANGDEQAFAQLFYTHHQAVGDYILTLTKSREAAEEIVQDAFIKAWRLREDLAGIRSFRSWLYSVCRNQAFNVLRDQARLALRQRKWLDHQEYQGESPDEQNREHLYQLIDAAVAQLPLQQQKAYLLSRSAGMSHKEIAREMELSRETVKRHISLALKSITAYLRSHPSRIPALILFFDFFKN
jgi:RNA polymerase sigma-70 factor (ECF subfamily)